MSYLLLVTEGGESGHVGQTSIITCKNFNEVRTERDKAVKSGFSLGDMRLFAIVAEVDISLVGWKNKI